MNFTLSLLAGLLLLLPGIAGLVSWNARGGSEGARRPELQLTSITALLIVIGLALGMHILGYGVVSLVWASAAEIGDWLARPDLPPLIENPYGTAAALALGHGSPHPESIAAFGAATVAEAIVAWRLVTSRGLEIATIDIDMRGQGWVFDHVVRPARHGYRPIAYVLTNPPQGEYGIGYEGVVADIRQGDGGELRMISLGEPQRFVYRLDGPAEDEPRRPPRLTIADREWVGGVVALDASVVRNVVVHVIPADFIEEVETTQDPATEADGPPPEGGQ